MIAYILSFAGGIATGVALLLAHQYVVRRATRAERRLAEAEKQKMQRRIEQLQRTIEEQREDLNAYECSSVAAHARQQGKVVGFREGSNLSQAERLASTLQGGPEGRRTVQMGGAQQ